MPCKPVCFLTFDTCRTEQVFFFTNNLSQCCAMLCCGYSAMQVEGPFGKGAVKRRAYFGYTWVVFVQRSCLRFVNAFVRSEVSYFLYPIKFTFEVPCVLNVINSQYKKQLTDDGSCTLRHELVMVFLPVALKVKHEIIHIINQGIN